jgi:hypothetical protein
MWSRIRYRSNARGRLLRGRALSKNRCFAVEPATKNEGRPHGRTALFFAHMPCPLAGMVTPLKNTQLPAVAGRTDDKKRSSILPERASFSLPLTGCGPMPADPKKPWFTPRAHSANARRVCGKLCGECLQIWAKCCGLCSFKGFEPRRSSSANVNRYLNLRAIQRFRGSILPNSCNGHEKMAIFHIGR